MSFLLKKNRRPLRGRRRWSFAAEGVGGRGGESRAAFHDAWIALAFAKYCV
jgi:hypothetical protein